MNDKDIIHILRHKRHDWMNQLQLVDGYASMGKMDRMKEQLDKIITDAEQERRLLNSSAYHFSIWLLTFNWENQQCRLSYVINEDIDLSRHDEQLVAYANQTLDILNEHCLFGELYEGTIQIKKNQQQEKENVVVSWDWLGSFKDEPLLMEKLYNKGFSASLDTGSELSIEITIE
ncbi:Spo0B domain-containing protein [Halobacillus seohaensis]|uniref:Spo0B domain-containing protein n=1 Tax=Halobacillus seohaensis TaxID=447421 RepID=A0ABW2EEK3_9BACI